jgi:hypothetical protein
VKNLDQASSKIAINLFQFISISKGLEDRYRSVMYFLLPLIRRRFGKPMPLLAQVCAAKRGSAGRQNLGGADPQVPTSNAQP